MSTVWFRFAGAQLVPREQLNRTWVSLTFVNHCFEYSVGFMDSNSTTSNSALTLSILPARDLHELSIICINTTQALGMILNLKTRMSSTPAPIISQLRSLEDSPAEISSTTYSGLD
ncbi:hypothetical protein AAHC03_04336 [Spirometra sp. Aus1]